MDNELISRKFEIESKFFSWMLKRTQTVGT
jgi:hypothetical protein